MITAESGPTKPEAGVIATRPATAPEQMPSTEGLPLMSHSVNIQASAAAAVAMWVAANAMPARPSEATAEPALKPNQPTHRSDAPTTVGVVWYGATAPLPSPWRLPSISALASPAIPALICTTVPPAKSSCVALSQPEGSHIQCATGQYTTSSQIPMNHIMAENFMRSANEPQISAGVMMAKVAWNIAYTVSGMVTPRCETDSLASSCMYTMPWKNARPVPPRYGVLPGVKASE